MKSPQMWMPGAIALLVFCLAPPIWPQCPAKTTISDTLLNADGTPAAGRVVIAWPTYQAGGCQVIAGQTTVTVNNGAFSVELYPNEGAVPSGTSYRTTYYLKSGRVTTEYWAVPASAVPVSLVAVRSSSVPVPTVMFSQSQVTNLLADLSRKVELPSPCPAGKFLQASGSASPPQVSCVDGTGAPLASPMQSGTVKTDVTEADPLVYTKATTDSLLAGKAGTSHAHAAADTTSGIFDPARLPNPSSSTLGGIKSGACSGTDKVTGVSTSGAITCAADQSGGGGSQHQVNGTNLAANDPVNLQDTTTIGFANPSAGNVQASVKDGAVTAAKLAALNPTGAQLGGLGDANISAGALSPNRISGTAEVQANKNTANGYAGIDAGSRIAKAQAPSVTVYTDASNTWNTGTQDMSGAGATLPVKASTSLPGSCVANKELFIDTDATPAGQQVYLCNGTGNGWNLVGDGGGGGLLDYQNAASALVGDGTDKTVFAYTLPGGTMGAGKCIEVLWQWQHTTGTAAVTYRLYFGSSNISTGGQTSGSLGSGHALICNNVGATNAQRINLMRWMLGSAHIGLGEASPAENATGNVVVKFTFNAASTDQVTPESWLVRLVN